MGIYPINNIVAKLGVMHKAEIGERAKNGIAFSKATFRGYSVIYCVIFYTAYEAMMK